MAHLRRTVAPQEEKETGRIEAFSDGVFAIAVTLLVLDLHVPAYKDGAAAGTLLHNLMGEWPSFLAYVTSFLTVLVMWLNHHRLFSHIRRVDHTLLILNGLLLMGITIVPFPTELVAAYIRTPDAVTAVAVYNGVYILIAVFYNALWHHARRDFRLLSRQADAAAVRAIDRQYRFGPIIYVVTLGLGFVNVVASVVLCLAMAVYFALPGKYWE
jgi:uncharacterized membrane protein